MTKTTAASALLLVTLCAPALHAEEPAPPLPLPVDVTDAAKAPLPPPDDYRPSAAPADVSTSSSLDGFVWSFVKSMLMLSFVLALVYLVLHKGVGRLVQRTQMGRRMRVVERIALDQRRALYLVDVDGKEVLLAASEGGVTAIDVKHDQGRAQPSSPAAPSVRFATELSRRSGVEGDGQPRAGAMPKTSNEGVEG